MRFFTVYRQATNNPLDPGPYLVAQPIDGVCATHHAIACGIAEYRNPVHPWESLVLIEQHTWHGTTQCRQLAMERDRQIEQMREMCEGAVI